MELIEIKSYPDEHYTEKVTLDDLAERFFINKFYLSKFFKAGVLSAWFNLQCDCGSAHGYLVLEDDTLMQWCVDNDLCGVFLSYENI